MRKLAALSEHAEKYSSAAWHQEDMTFEKALLAATSEEQLWNKTIKEQRAQLKAAKKRSEKEKIKSAIAESERALADILDTKAAMTEAVWLTSKFGMDGTYQDVAGLCRIASIAEIAEKNYSLTPGAYVGVSEAEDDGVDFHERMNEIHAELARLSTEANQLMGEIQKSWEGMR